MWKCDGCEGGTSLGTLLMNPVHELGQSIHPSYCVTFFLLFSAPVMRHFSECRIPGGLLPTAALPVERRRSQTGCREFIGIQIVN